MVEKWNVDLHKVSRSRQYFDKRKALQESINKKYVKDINVYEYLKDDWLLWYFMSNWK